jgi:hypothetical protein
LTSLLFHICYGNYPLFIHASLQLTVRDQARKVTRAVIEGGWWQEACTDYEVTDSFAGRKCVEGGEELCYIKHFPYF